MGEIRTEVQIENAGDRAVFEHGHGTEAAIRRATVEGIIDTGAVTLLLPENVVERLGLQEQATAHVTYADNRRDERPVGGRSPSGSGTAYSSEQLDARTTAPAGTQNARRTTARQAKGSRAESRVDQNRKALRSRASAARRAPSTATGTNGAPWRPYGRQPGNASQSR